MCAHLCVSTYILLPPPAVEWSNNQSSSPSFWPVHLLPIGTHLEHNKNQSHKKIRNEYYKKGNKTTTTKKGMKFMSRLAVKGSKLFGFVFLLSQKSCWNKIRVNWLAFVTFLRGRGGKTLSFSTPPMCRKLRYWHEEENGNLKKKNL